MNQREGSAPPAWLSGQTIAIVSTVLTVGVGIGAMVFASTSSIRGEVAGLAGKIEETHKSLSAEIKGVRAELKADIGGLDARLRVVEQDVAVIKDRLTVRRPVTQGASPLDYEADDADA